MAIRLRDVQVGDEVVVADWTVTTRATVEAVDATTVTAGGVHADKSTGYALRLVDGVRLWLMTPTEYARDRGARELGRYLAALHLLLEDGADVDELAGRLSDADLIAACHAGQKLCDLLGVRP